MIAIKGGLMTSADPRDPVFGQPYVGTTDVQTVTVNGAPTGGTYTLSFNGQTTSALAFNAVAADIQAALVALSTIGAGNVTVTGSGPFVVTFAGALAPGYQPDITADGSLLTGGTSPSVTVAHTVSGLPEEQAAFSGTRTVLDMYRLVQRTISVSTSDNHYTADGDLYHE